MNRVVTHINVYLLMGSDSLKSSGMMVNACHKKKQYLFIFSNAPVVSKHFPEEASRYLMCFE